MTRWLTPEVTDRQIASRIPAPPPARPEDLTCFSKIPANASNFSIHRSFIQTHKLETPETLDEWERRRANLLDWLQRTVFSWFPSEPIPFRTRRLPHSGGHALRFARFSAWEFETEPRASVHIHLFEPKEQAEDAPLIIAVKRCGDQVVFPDDELLPLLASHRVLVLMPRFAKWTPCPAEYAATERTAAICGRTIAALQVWDVIRAARWTQDERGLAAVQIHIFGRGTAGIVALYAALFENAISQVILDAPPASHREEPALLAILRGTDIPEVAAALAPRRLTFLADEIPPAYSLAGEVYRLFGSQSRMTCRPSLVEAVHSGR